ncbi:MAG: adenosylhomocysteinase [Nitrososphaerota archaeon]|nr:adenosylhomocysteinase [Candidatus Bathyarchaeota archaeon]MDW8049381.1 adenosylhomocysteinase [Nitrososphaerota archaeon]
MQEFKVKDIGLAENGRLLVEWAAMHMPVLSKIAERFRREKPLEGLNIGACLHVTKETAVLVEALAEGGAEVSLCGSNPLSTQDEVAAYLAKQGIHVYAWKGETTDEYYWCVNRVIDHQPTITLDDGADLVTTIHTSRAEALLDVKGGTEETTTGVIRLKAMAEKGALRYPIIAVNDAYTKYLFDNRYGTGQSSIDGILRATNILLAGKKFVVCGYGWCGRGLALRARGMGANVIVTEVNPIRALEAVMDGFQVMPLTEASEVGDIFVTVTGNINVIRKEHFSRMKDGAIIANSGHFNVEVKIPDLEELSTSKRTVRPNLQEYMLRDGRRIYLLAEGRLVNLAAAEGHPSEVMDMSFSNQALCVEYIANAPRMEPRVYNVPPEIDELVARMKLEGMGIKIDQMTEEQKQYISSWEAGTI